MELLHADLMPPPPPTSASSRGRALGAGKATPSSPSPRVAAREPGARSCSSATAHERGGRWDELGLAGVRRRTATEQERERGASVPVGEERKRENGREER
jgi:hypothetical protein